MKHTGAEPRKQASTLREKRPEFLPLLCSVRQFISFVTRSLQCFLDQEDGGEGRRKQQCGAQLFHQSSTTSTLFTLSIYINTHTRHTEKRKKIGFFFSHLLGLHVKAKWLLTDTRHGWNFFSCPTQTQKERGETASVLCYVSSPFGTVFVALSPKICRSVGGTNRERCRGMRLAIPRYLSRETQWPAIPFIFSISDVQLLRLTLTLAISTMRRAKTSR